MLIKKRHAPNIALRLTCQVKRKKSRPCLKIFSSAFFFRLVKLGYDQERCWKHLRFKKLPRIFFYLIITYFCFFFNFSLLAEKVEYLIPDIIKKMPHDQTAFTEGLAIEDDLLYESTGLYGYSSLRLLDILTGEILKKNDLSPMIFAEGIAAFPEQLFQISYREQKAFVYERSSLKLLKILFYSGEGWGLCRDGNTLWMSNGSSILTQRDLQTFAIVRKLNVSLNGKALELLNDLECDGNQLYANVWLKDWLVRIDKTSGQVTGIIDASKLLHINEKNRLELGSVLNGIAFRPKTKTFFLTGKGWPWIFEVKFIPQKK